MMWKMISSGMLGLLVSGWGAEANAQRYGPYHGFDWRKLVEDLADDDIEGRVDLPFGLDVRFDGDKRDRRRYDRYDGRYGRYDGPYERRPRTMYYGDWGYRDPWSNRREYRERYPDPDQYRRHAYRDWYDGRRRRNLADAYRIARMGDMLLQRLQADRRIRYRRPELLERAEHFAKAADRLYEQTRERRGALAHWQFEAAFDQWTQLDRRLSRLDADRHERALDIARELDRRLSRLEDRIGR